MRGAPDRAYGKASSSKAYQPIQPPDPLAPQVDVSLDHLRVFQNLRGQQQQLYGMTREHAAKLFGQWPVHSVAPTPDKDEVMRTPSIEGYYPTELEVLPDRIAPGWYGSPDYPSAFLWDPKGEITAEMNRVAEAIPAYERFDGNMSWLLLSMVTHPLTLVMCTQVCKTWRKTLLQDTEPVRYLWLRAIREEMDLWGPHNRTIPHVPYTVPSMAAFVSRLHPIPVLNLGKQADITMKLLLGEDTLEQREARIDSLSSARNVPTIKVRHDLSAHYLHQRYLNSVELWRWSENQVICTQGIPEAPVLITYTGTPPYTDQATTRATFTRITPKFLDGVRLLYRLRLHCTPKFLAVVPTQAVDYDALRREWFCPREDAADNLLAYWRLHAEGSDSVSRVIISLLSGEGIGLPDASAREKLQRLTSPPFTRREGHVNIHCRDIYQNLLEMVTGD